MCNAHFTRVVEEWVSSDPEGVMWDCLCACGHGGLWPFSLGYYVWGLCKYFGYKYKPFGSCKTKVQVSAILAGSSTFSVDETYQLVWHKLQVWGHGALLESGCSLWSCSQVRVRWDVSTETIQGSNLHASWTPFSGGKRSGGGHVANPEYARKIGMGMSCNFPKIDAGCLGEGHVDYHSLVPPQHRAW